MQSLSIFFTVETCIYSSHVKNKKKKQNQESIRFPGGRSNKAGRLLNNERVRSFLCVSLDPLTKEIRSVRSLPCFNGKQALQKESGRKVEEGGRRNGGD